MIGSTELVIIVAAGLVLFGASAVPKFARSLGQARKEFKKGLQESEEDQEEKSGKEREKDTDHGN